jgi:tripartite-type tricarboxylate transporter receptor subunit TctC
MLASAVGSRASADEIVPNTVKRPRAARTLDLNAAWPHRADRQVVRLGMVLRAGLLVAGLQILLALALAAPSLAQTPAAENFYQGKVITLVAGYAPAGAPDVYARLVAKHLGRFLPGEPTIIVKNMPGGGGILAANYMSNVAPRDGSFIALLAPTIALEEVLGSTASRYHATAFNWIGRVAANSNITFVRANSAVQTIADAFKKVAVLGATGRSSTNSTFPAVLNNVIGTKFKIVMGYAGTADAMLAMERGEVDGVSATLDGLMTLHSGWVADKKVNILVQYLSKRLRDLPDVPTAPELAQTPEQAEILGTVCKVSDMGKFILTTPQAPADRVAVLRQAFDQMIKDPEFLADADRLHIDLDPLPGTDLSELVRQVQNTPKNILDQVKPDYPLN